MQAWNRFAVRLSLAIFFVVGEGAAAEPRNSAGNSEQKSSKSVSAATSVKNIAQPQTSTAPSSPQTTPSNSVATGFLDRIYRDATGSHKYVVFVPPGYTPHREWPMMLFLHGAGERGTDGRRQLSVGLGPVLEKHPQDFPCVVVFPQCEETRGRVLTAWVSASPDGKRALEILKEVEKEFRIDSSRRMLTGWSMGGYGVWDMGAKYPELWSVVMPISGGGNPAEVSGLVGKPLWTCHGLDDTIVRPESTQKMVDALKAAGGKPWQSELKGQGHDICESVFSRSELRDWLFRPTSSTTKPDQVEFSPAVRPEFSFTPSPFTPAIIVPQAMGVRLGNDALQTLSQGIPQLLEQGTPGTSGSLDDITATTEYEGDQLQVRLAGIKFQTEVDEVRAAGIGPQRLSLLVGLRRLTIHIGSTTIVGHSHRATTGPFKIVIGHRRPVWMVTEVSPSVRSGNWKIEILNRRFQIPDNNWYITEPEKVTSTGGTLTPEYVTIGVIGSLYKRKEQLEKQVEAIIPDLVHQVERRLTTVDVGNRVAIFWPLPVNQPRVRLQAEDVTVDRDGVSLSFGLAAAALAPEFTPKTPKQFPSGGVTLASLPHSNDLELRVAPGVLGALSQLMIDADSARINVLDLPEPLFAQLADRERLIRALPELATLDPASELFVELALSSAFSVRAKSTDENIAPRSAAGELSRSSSATCEKGTNFTSNAPGGSLTVAPSHSTDVALTLEAPRLSLIISVKRPQDALARPYAQLDFSLTQPISSTLQRPEYDSRQVAIDWQPCLPPSGTLNFAGEVSPSPSDSTRHPEELLAAFHEAWRAWCRRQSGTTQVSDLAMGSSALRLERLASSQGRVVLAFRTPATRFRNLTEENFDYLVRTHHSPWGGPFTLAPQETQQLPARAPLLLQLPRGAGPWTQSLIPGGDYVLEYISSDRMFYRVGSGASKEKVTNKSDAETSVQ